MLRHGFLRNAYAGQGTEQAIQSICICMAGFGQVIDAAHTISKRIGNAEACSRAEYAAAGIRHCHFDESRIRRDIANATIRLRHQAPPILGKNIKGEDLLTGR